MNSPLLSHRVCLLAMRGSSIAGRRGLVPFLVLNEYCHLCSYGFQGSPASDRANLSEFLTGYSFSRRKLQHTLIYVQGIALASGLCCAFSLRQQGPYQRIAGSVFVVMIGFFELFDRLVYRALVVSRPPAGGLSNN
jgi:hypothetical protein